MLFLDVGGVLNTRGAVSCGVLLPAPLAGLRRVLAASGAEVVLSTPWRSLASLWPLVAGALPPGAVVGQTPEGFQNHALPCELASFPALPEVQQAMADPGPEWAAVDDRGSVSQAEALACGGGAVGSLLLQLRRRFVRTDRSEGLDAAAEASLLGLLGAAPGT